MRSILVGLACLILAANADAQTAVPPIETILDLPLGTLVEVRLRQGDKLRGRLDAVGDRDFQITVAEGSRLASRSITYAEVAKLKPYEPPNAGKIVVRVLAAFGCMMYLFTAIALGG